MNVEKQVASMTLSTQLLSLWNIILFFFDGRTFQMQLHDQLYLVRLAELKKD